MAPMALLTLPTEVLLDATQNPHSESPPARVKLLVASVMQPMADDSLHAKPL